MSAVGQNVKAARLERQVSLTQLSRASGLSKGFLSQVETGICNPSLTSLDKISSALGISTPRLISAGSERAANPLVPSLPMLLGSTHSRSAGGNIDVLNATEGGTHLLVELPPGIQLSSSESLTTGSVLAVVLDGSVFVSQSQATLQVAEGGVGTWNGGATYSIATPGNSRARFVLFVPQFLAIPTLGPAQVVQPVGAGTTPVRVLESTRASTSRNLTGRTDGPLRLVEMRARRLAGRKRNP